jgi:glycosyltransferase involved in cell wall biosynthesis
MQQAEVSVVIPTFNRAYCIAEAIDSVLNQTHRNCRALVIDDGSTDGTRALITQRYGNEPRVVYEYQANQGVVAARNRGLAMAGGDFVAFLDSDDAWRPWKVELQLICLARLPQSVGMIWTDMDAFDAQGTIVAPRYLRKMYGAYKRHSTESVFSNSASLESQGIGVADVAATTKLYWGDIFSAMVTGNLVHTSTVLLRRERAQQVARFNEALRFAGEDFDFHLRTCRAGPVAFVDVCSILYRVGQEDRLTRPSYHVHIAENYLKTITPVLAEDRARLTLSDAAIEALLARAHAWIAEGKFETGDFSGARHHAWQSLRRSWRQRRTWEILAASTVPSFARRGMLDAYRGLKRLRS